MENRKKILIYNGQLFMGGIERVLISYLKGLSQEKNLDITLLVKINDPEKNVFLRDIPKNIKVEFIRSEEFCKKREEISRKKKKNIYYKFLYQLDLIQGRLNMKKWIKNYFEKNKFDFILDFDTGLRKEIKYIDAPVITWCHYTFSKLKRKNNKNFIEQFGKYEKIVLICDEMKNEFEDLYPHLKDKGVRIYNPLNTEEILKKSENMEDISPEELKLLNENYLVAVSRLVKGKGREDLVDIYLNLKKRGIKEKLYILGDDPEFENLKTKIQEFNLEEDVLLLGQKANPYIWMKNAKLFIHTSYGEGLPTVFIESMICGTPVAAYDCPTGPKEILGNGEYGILVPMGNKEIMENEIYNLLDNSENIEKLRKKLLNKTKDFDEKNIIQILMKILDDIKKERKVDE